MRMEKKLAKEDKNNLGEVILCLRLLGEKRCCCDRMPEDRNDKLRQ